MVREVLFRRLLAAFSTLPTRECWLDACVFLLILALTLLPIGFKVRFFEFSRFPPIPLAIRLALIVAFTPALAEETLFRALLLPHPNEHLPSNDVWSWGTLGLLLFVGYHP